MPLPLRIATFNVENLFGRAKALNLDDHKLSDTILADVGALQAELDEKVYKKTEIMKLYNKVKDYISISEDRGKLFKKKGWKVIGVKAGGKADWDGSIVFKKAKFNKIARSNTAWVIKQLQADILCVVEVESRPVLSAFNSQRVKSGFKYNMVIDGNDDRGIDVGILSKYEIFGMWSNIFEKSGKSEVFSRDCAEYEIILKNGQSLYILCNHFKSRGYGKAAKSDARRRKQAEHVARILKTEYDLDNDLVVVAGDLNDSPDRPPKTLQPLLGMVKLKDVLELQFGNSTNDRWTYYYNKKEQIDYLLVSKPLAAAFQSAGVERRGIYNLSGITGGAEKSYHKVTHWSNAASDHGAVYADFLLP